MKTQTICISDLVPSAGLVYESSGFIRVYLRLSAVASGVGA
jgi:hypothetical protein